MVMIIISNAILLVFFAHYLPTNFSRLRILCICVCTCKMRHRSLIESDRIVAHNFKYLGVALRLVMRRYR